jgi:hypothetical protein
VTRRTEKEGAGVDNSSRIHKVHQTMSTNKNDSVPRERSFASYYAAKFAREAMPRPYDWKIKARSAHDYELEQVGGFDHESANGK